jgi:hypothetical protein
MLLARLIKIPIRTIQLQYVTGKQCVELPAENAEDEKPENCQDDSRPSSRCSHENGQTEMKNSPEVGNSSLSKSIKIELTRIEKSNSTW